MSTTSIEPGIYTIINVRHETETLVPIGNDFVTSGSQVLDREWLIRPSEGYYEIQEAKTRRYLTVPALNIGQGYPSQIMVGLDKRNPFLWDIVNRTPKEIEGTYFLQLPGLDCDYRLEMIYTPSQLYRTPIQLSYCGAPYSNISYSNTRSDTKMWRLNRLGPLPPGQPDAGAVESSAAVPASLTIAQSTDTSQPESGLSVTPKDQLLAQLAQLAGQFAQNNSRTTELIGQLAEMSREIQGQKQQIEDKERQIQRLMKTIEEKDVQLSVFAHMVQGNNSLYPGQSQSQAPGGVGTSGGGDGENVSNEVSTLREKVEYLEDLVKRVSGTWWREHLSAIG